MIYFRAKKLFRQDIMITKEIKLIEYSKNVDRGNCISHALGAVLAVAGAVFLLLRAEEMRQILSAVIYCFSLICVYTVSATYHGLATGEAKRIARLIDHSAIPVLIAGTATPCALITVYEISPAHSLTVLIIAWFCALFGVFAKLFFFQKLRKVTVAVYIISCAAMLLSVVPIIGEINAAAFRGILAGCVLYLIGAFFCWLGIKREAFHIVFHVFVLLGSAAHFYVIYTYMF